MSTLITILHVIVCVFLMLTVLMQEGKSGGMGGAFGGSNAGTVFGGSGSSSFLRRLTTVCATVFMFTSIVLAYLASHNAADSLEKFGSAEAKRAEQKQQAIDKGLKAGSGSDAGSASGPSMMMPPSETGSATTPETGSATMGSAAAPASNSAATAEKPAPPAQPSMTPATPATVNPPSAPPAKAATPALTPAEKKANVPAPAQSPSEKAADKSAEKKPLTGTAAPVNPQPAETPAAGGTAPATPAN
ncbi:hypothetical protein BH11MYX2_BH11MYX2_36150 [soil metagenome]